MVMTNIHEAKTNLSALLRKVEEKNEVVILCRNGKPIAEIRSVAKKGDPFRVNPALRPIKMVGDMMEPLSEEDWPEDAR